MYGGYYETEGNMNAALKIANAFRHYTRETAAKTRAMMAKEINKTPEFQNDFFYNALAFLDRYFLGEVVEV